MFASSDRHLHLQNKGARTKVLQTSRPTVTSELPEGASDCSQLNLLHCCIIAAAAVILALPMFMYGPMLQGHDTREHLNYSRHFSEQFWSGEWYPRWLIGMNHGLGSPTLFVYPPLPSYVCTLLQPVGRLFHFNPFNMGELLALFGSGLCAFLWLTTIASQNVAVVSAVLYMLMPYHLAVDYYRRTALSECWALVWMPLVLYFTAKIVRMERKQRYCLGFAAAYALLLLSHLVSALIFSVIPVVIAVTFSSSGQKLKSAFHVVEGMLLGAGLSCFYVVPALAHAKYFPVSRLPLWSNLRGNLLTLGKLLHARQGGEFVRTVTVSTTEMALLCLVCGIVVLAKGSVASKKMVLFWLAISVISGFLVSGLSFRVWEASPLLFAAVQYPWRFDILLCMASIAIVTVFLSEVHRLRRLGQTGPLVVCALAMCVMLALVPGLMSYQGIWTSYKAQTAPPMPIVNDDDGWFPAWTPPGLDEASALAASAGSRIRFVSGIGSAKILLWKARHIEFQTNSSTGGAVMINQFYYPSWQAGSNFGHHLQTGIAMPAGLIELEVPPGAQQVSLEIPIGIAEQAGRWISLACLLVSIGMVLSQRRSNSDLMTAPAAGSAATFALDRGTVLKEIAKPILQRRIE